LTQRETAERGEQITMSARDCRKAFSMFSPRLEELASSSRSRKTGKIRLGTTPSGLAFRTSRDGTR
jgi:hypothetical protein